MINLMVNCEGLNVCLCNIEEGEYIKNEAIAASNGDSNDEDIKNNKYEKSAIKWRSKW